jgi:hypothetical protein
MIKVEKLTDKMSPSHYSVVFASKQDSDNKDMSKAVGRFDEQRRAIALLNTELGKKYKALMDGGFQVFLNKDIRDNFYITQVEDAIEHLKKGSYSDFAMQESIEDAEDENEEAVELDKVDKERPELEYVEEEEFLENHIDSAMDLDFTTENLKYEHRVGMYNEHDNVYTLRDDTKDLLNEFEFHVDENEDGVVARINNESINARVLLRLINLLKQQEQEDDEELQEALESNGVNVHALAGVQSLLKRLSLAQRHGDLDESDEVEQDLEEIIQKYEQANPPATGIDELYDEIEEIMSREIQESAQNHKSLSKSQQMANAKRNRQQRKSNSQKRRKQSASQRVSKAVSKTAKKTAKKAGKAASSSAKNWAKDEFDKGMDNQKVESIAERMQRESDLTQLTMNLLEQDGTQLRGQQGEMKYVY